MRDRLVLRPRRATLLILALAASSAGPAFAQPTPPAAPSPDAPAAPDPSKKAEAKAHFEKGWGLFQESSYAAAYAELRISRELYPSRVATAYGARALKKLQRYDESLDLYEALLRDFPDMPADEKTEAQKALAEMRELVGTIELRGVEVGSAIVLAGQSRGEYPLLSPLRVAAGSHVLRVVKEGFEPFEKTVDVAGGQAVSVTVALKPLAASGQLKVAESSGRALEVLVDKIHVGVTPWEGRLPPGKRTVLLRDSTGRIGTEPAVVEVKVGGVTPLSLRAVELDAALHVKPTPADAEVAIDSVSVGHGAWDGRLRAGEHRVEISADGFLPMRKDISIEHGGRAIVSEALARDPNAAKWQIPSRWTFDVSAAFAIVPSLVDRDKSCTGTCIAPIGPGGVLLLHGGYQLGNGFGFGVFAGYLLAAQSGRGTSAALTPIGGKSSLVAADDDLRLSALLAGASMFYHLGTDWPVLARLGLGVMAGRVRDERTHHLSSEPYRVVDTKGATYLLGDVELRAGRRFAKSHELGLGVQVMLLYAPSPPAWDGSMQVDAGAQGIGYYGADAMMNKLIIGVAPTLSYRREW